MKRVWIAVTALVSVGLGCRPEVGAPISQINGPAILAVKAVPAEADPRAGNHVVVYEALAVDLGGRVPAPGADITEPLLWAMCDQPKPPTESNSVSSSCGDSYANPGVVGSSGTTYSAPVADNACALFGPTIPPVKEGETPIRPRDPDITGGYYQPVRVELLVPEELHRVGMSTGDSLIAIHMQRVSCGLANARGLDIVTYGKEYRANSNPVLVSLTLQVQGTDPLDVPAAAAVATAIPVPIRQSIALAANWSADSVEKYPAQDPITRELGDHFESMRVSWFATGGSFQHDVTGRGEDEHDTTYAENSWTSETPGLVHLWVVLNDARGGTDFAAIDLDVTP